MSKHERVSAAYDYIRRHGIILNHQELADKMKRNRSTVTGALNGNPRYLTDSFLKTFNESIGNIFNEDWLLTGEGEMLNGAVNQQAIGDGNTQVAGNGNNVNSEASHFLGEIAAQRRLTEKALEQVDRLLSVIESMQGISGKT